MDEFNYPDVNEWGACWYARAASSGIWLTRSGAGVLGTTRDFSMALACDSKVTANALWSELAQKAMEGKSPPAWSKSPPQLFKGVDPSKGVDSLTAYLAVCQGRFVMEKVNMGSVQWLLTPNPSEARIFMTQADAIGALHNAMPSVVEKAECAVLPLRCSFGAPIRGVEGHPIDGLAGALAANSARKSLEGAVPEANPLKAKLKIKSI